nr:ankyrin repeat-containing domain, PGG domain protein [Tanacetum cinerariifolium]
MLHLVGKIAKKKRLEDVSGFALQMQRELLWFQEIRNMIPPSYRERKNKDDLTPHELFTKEHKDLVIRGEEWMKEEAKQISANVDQVSELEKLISKHILDMHTETHNIIRGPSAFGQEDQAQHLQNLISTHFAKLLVKTKSIIDRAPAVPAPKPTYSNRVLFVATEMGNTKFLVELIRLYPDLIWKVNDNGLSVFHIAVKHRHEGIYNLLHEIGAMKDMITPLRDEHENNMLHLVGKIAKKKRLEDVSGFALQMQRELLWFQMTNQTVAQSATISVQNPVSQQQHEIKDTATADSKANAKRLTPNLPCRDLLRGLRKDYLQIAVPLYEASIKCDWKAAKAVIDNRRHAICRSYQKALAAFQSHFIDASYRGTAIWRLRDDGWTDTNRGWLLEKCVENDMFDVALEIVKKYPKLGTSGSVLGILARKAEAFPDAEHSITGRNINSIKRLYSFMSITHQPSQSKHPEIGTESISAEQLDQKAEPSPKPKCNIICQTIKSGKHHFKCLSIK